MWAHVSASLVMLFMSRTHFKLELRLAGLIFWITNFKFIDITKLSFL